MVLTLSGCSVLGSVIKRYGYVELRPPSTLLMPGALVYVRDDDPFVAGVICPAGDSMGEAYQPRTSPTASSEMRQANGATVRLGANALGALKADARFEAVESLEATLTNAVVLEVDDSDVLEHLSNRTPACAAAVSQRLAAKFPVTMISSALVGDVVYAVSWRSGASLGIGGRDQVLNDLAGELGGTRVGEQQVTAKGLVWGVRDDRYLAGLSIPSVDQDQIPRGQRALPVAAGTAVVKAGQ